MDKIKHYNTVPQQHIRDLFEATKDGKVDITCICELEAPFELTYEISWTREDAESLVKMYEALTEALTEIGRQHNNLTSEEKCEELLSHEALEVWKTYIRPFEEKFEADDALIIELYERDDLSKEETELLERYYEWFEACCLKRLPAKNFSPMHLIDRARRYERAVSLNTSDTILNNEKFYLAEEMVLYHFSMGPSLEKIPLEDLFRLIDE